MATIGLNSLYYAVITEESDGSETYGTPVKLAKAMTAELSIDVNEATLYADDAAAEVVKEFKSGTLSLGVDDIGASVASKLTGAQIDNNGVVVSASENTPSAVAVGFRAKKSNGDYKYYWLYRVIFGIPSANLTTKGDGITFSTPTIEGVIYRRNKTDDAGKHPWKAEADESDASVPASVISSWFSAVYEPVITVITIMTQPADASVTSGSISGNLSVTATTSTGTLGYQWYSNTADSSTGGTLISGANSASMAIPTDLIAGSYYYYCKLSVGNTILTSDAATVTVS